MRKINILHKTIFMVTGAMFLISSCNQSFKKDNENETTNYLSENYNEILIDESMKTDSLEKKSMNLNPLFEAVLNYDNSVEVMIPIEGRSGDFIGKGSGTIKGEKISGKIFWQFYAENCAYLWIKEGQTPPADQHLCKTNPGGIIKTNDGVEIRFDAKGYGFRGFDSSKPHLWKLTAALQFNTDDERYKWLNTKLGVWEGEFNENEGKAHYTAYIQM